MCATIQYLLYWTHLNEHSDVSCKFVTAGAISLSGMVALVNCFARVMQVPYQGLHLMPLTALPPPHNFSLGKLSSMLIVSNSMLKNTERVVGPWHFWLATGIPNSEQTSSSILRISVQSLDDKTYILSPWESTRFDSLFIYMRSKSGPRGQG